MKLCFACLLAFFAITSAHGGSLNCFNAAYVEVPTEPMARALTGQITHYEPRASNFAFAADLELSSPNDATLIVGESVYNFWRIIIFWLTHEDRALILYTHGVWLIAETYFDGRQWITPREHDYLCMAP